LIVLARGERAKKAFVAYVIAVVAMTSRGAPAAVPDWLTEQLFLTSVPEAPILLIT
jgi:hypothetical protein